MIELQERALVQLTQWLGRVLQYSIAHPSAQAFGTQVHAAFTKALEEGGAFDVGVLKDDLRFGETPARQPALRLRTAPHLHERGVLALRFAPGLREDELTTLVDVLTLPVPELFARGGLAKVLAERSVARVRVEEIVHELTAEERAAERRKKRIRSVFTDMLERIEARRGVGAKAADELFELLEHPDLAARLLEEQENVCEAVAGIVLLALQKERRSGVPLQDKVRAMLLELAPDVRARVFLGWPQLAGDFREAMSTIYATFEDRALARFAFPCVVLRTDDLDRFFYVAGGVATTAARRLALLRRVAGMLHDLPLESPASVELLGALASPPQGGDRYADARLVLGQAAERLASEAMLFDGPRAPSEPHPESFAPAALDRLSQREAREVVGLASTMVDFDQFCARLPRAAEYLAGGQGAAGVSSLVRALGGVTAPERRGAAESALRAIARSDAAMEVVKDVEGTAPALEGERLEEAIEVFKVIARERPEPLVDLLARIESRKVRRVLLDLLPEAGGALLPLVQRRLRAPEWYVVRNMVTLVRRAGGGAAELREPSRHPQPQVRLEVLRALRGLTDATAQEVLVSLLQDPVPEIRGGALAVLGEMDLEPPALGALAELAGDARKDDETRRRAIAALGRSRLDPAARALAALIEPHGIFESPSAAALRERAAAALHQSPAPLAPALFEQALQSSNRRVRKACERATGRGDE